jgi:hypothetical protein
VRGTVTLVFLLGAAVTGFGVGLPVVAVAADYEVWVIDQSDTTPEGGGTLYIYQGQALTGAAAASETPEIIDLGGTACGSCRRQATRSGSAIKTQTARAARATSSTRCAGAAPRPA